MKTYVKDLEVNSEVVSYFLVVDLPQVRKSKKDTDYWCFKLVDKTGEVDARLWEVPQGLEPSTFQKTFVKVRGQVSEWAGQKQVAVSQIRQVGADDPVDPVDFFQRSEREPEEMFSELMQIVGGVEGGYIRTLLFNILKKNKEKFCLAPAAKSIHHNYLGGLLEHSLSLCKTSLMLSDRYNLNRDLMVAACILHDIGKVKEMSYSMGIGYTIEGSLLGHISIGMVEVATAMDDLGEFPGELRIAILHLIASHHGALAWGSPRVPLMREAIAFHLCDMIDSKMAICDRVLKDGISPEGLGAWSKELEGQLWVGPWQKDEFANGAK
jgi:3'-5' exoribonuclease